MEGTKIRLEPQKQKLLLEDPESFRMQCGDSFSKAVQTGAAVYVMVQMLSKDESFKNSLETSNKIKAAFASFFSASIEVNTTQEQEQLLSSFTFNLSCFSIGADPSACSEPTGSFDGADKNGISSYLDRVRSQFAVSIEEKPELFVSIDESLEDYPKPTSVSDKSREEIFYDYSAQAKMLYDLLEREDKFNQVCGSGEPANCVEFEKEIAKQVRYCSKQSDWVDCKPDFESIDAFLNELGAVSEAQPLGTGRYGGITLTVFQVDKPSF